MSTASTIEPQAAPAPKVPYPSTGYSWYVVAVLLSVYILAYIDRQILGVLVAPIKRDLDINDTQMSLLLGFAFAMFYTIVGLPIGRLADRTNRRNLILTGTTIWSISTAFCGIAKNYGQLFVARMGVGLGEACLNPAVVPMLSDYFPKEKLGRAMGVYMLGVSIGGGLAHIVGGEFLPVLTSQTPVDLPLFGAVLPWEAMLIALGCTGGLMVALLFTVREPARQGETKRDASGKVVNLPLRAVCSHLGRHWKAYCAIGWPLAASALMTFGVGYWVPSFFLRSYNLTEAAAGQYLGAFGLMSMICGGIGVVGGGFLVDWLGKKYADGHLRTLLLGICLLAPGYGIFALMPNPTLAIIVMIPAVIGGGILQATGVTTLMAVVPPQMKSQIAALYFFIVNLIGAAVGPTAIAVLTDSVFADESMLRFSIAIVALGTGATAVAVLLAGRASYRRMLTEEF